jgi:primosomal protein N' (replication factor Y)
MDTDTMRGHDAHEKALERFRRGEIRILLGTQMIAKGLDFPNVTLVGVVNADTGLHLPDFRAGERTFQLVTQVAGRTGRGEQGGRVLVQTFSPDHRAIRAAVRHDYAGFATAELPDRETFHYPPFASLVRIVFRGSVEQATEEFAAHVGQLVRRGLQEQGGAPRALGPVAAPIARLRGKHRYHMLLQGTDRAALCRVVRETVGSVKTPADIQWIVDADPLSML